MTTTDEIKQAAAADPEPVYTRIIQYLTYLIPLRYFLAIARGIFLKGSGIAILWPQALMLAALSAIILTLSALRFSKRLM